MRDLGVRVAIGAHSLDFIDVGQDAWAQSLRNGRTDLMETTSILTWSALTATARNAVDVGGFNGLYALIAAKSGASRAFCFEPVALSYGTLVLNLRMNAMDGKVVAVNCALGDSPGRTLINSQSGPYVMASGESLLEDWAYRFPVEVQRFDDIWSGRSEALAWPTSVFVGTIDAIKIDVEGFEVHVLEGMKSVIFAEDNRPHILVELLNRRAVSDFFRAVPREYHCYAISEGERQLRPLSPDEAPDAHVGNFLFTTLDAQEVAALEARVQEQAVESMWECAPLVVNGLQSPPAPAGRADGGDLDADKRSNDALHDE